MSTPRSRLRLSLVLALCVAASSPAAAQQNGGFLDNLFNRGDEPQQGQPQPRRGGGGEGAYAQSDPGELAVRLDRIENQMRQLTGTIEQLQFRNQQLESQLQLMQQDAAARAGGAPPRGPAGPPPQQYQQPQLQQPPAQPGRRGDAFDPAQSPTAPGAPRTLGNQTAMVQQSEPPIGAPGGRKAGAPLDLGTMSANASASGQPLPPMQQGSPQQSQPAQPPRVINGNPQLATLPPTAKPQDEYDMAYGYVLHKDYALAEQGFRNFLGKYPNERLVPDAQYWLGESLFQQQRYRDAAESFLTVSTRHDKSTRAPDSLLRLGQSLAALNKKEAACATLAEVERKYPKASGTVKRNVAAEQKRARC